MLHATAPHGNSHDGHTVGPMISDLEALTGVDTRRFHVDKGYRGRSRWHKFGVRIIGNRLLLLPDPPAHASGSLHGL